MDIHSYHPYRWRVFWVVTTVTMVLSLIGATITYYQLAASQLQRTQDDLQAIATKTANLVPASMHEQLRVSDDVRSSNYETIQKLFKSVMAGNPKIDDIYTLRPTNQPHTMTFVVSGKDSTDQNHNGIIDDDEVKPALGESYSTANQPDLEQGLKEPTHDRAITYDKWGEWLSGYAPVRDAGGHVVAVLGVDYSAAVITAQRELVLRTMGWTALGLIPLSMLAAWLLSLRTQRPFKMLATAMDRVLHGEPEYKIPVTKNKDQATLAHLFNTMTHVMRDVARDEVKKQKSGHPSE